MAIQELKLSTGTKVWLERFTGTVLSEKKWTETHVSSSGGGGAFHVHNGSGSGYVNAPRLNSRTSEQHEIWLQDESGKEESFKLSDFGLPLREGQKLTVVWGAPKGAKQGDIIAILNHHASRWYGASGLPGGVRPSFGASLVRASVYAALTFVAFALFFSFGALIPAIAVGIVALAVTHNSARKRLNRELFQQVISDGAGGAPGAIESFLWGRWIAPTVAAVVSIWVGGYIWIQDQTGKAKEEAKLVVAQEVAKARVRSQSEREQYDARVRAERNLLAGMTAGAVDGSGMRVPREFELDGKDGVLLTRYTARVLARRAFPELDQVPTAMKHLKGIPAESNQAMLSAYQAYLAAQQGSGKQGAELEFAKLADEYLRVASATPYFFLEPLPAWLGDYDSDRRGFPVIYKSIGEQGGFEELPFETGDADVKRQIPALSPARNPLSFVEVLDEDKRRKLSQAARYVYRVALILAPPIKFAKLSQESGPPVIVAMGTPIGLVVFEHSTREVLVRLDLKDVKKGVQAASAPMPRIAAVPE